MAQVAATFVSSLPMALTGGFIALNEHVYKTATGIVLLLAGPTTILRREPVKDRGHDAPLWGVLSMRALVGLVSGLAGVGGGVFLAPALIALGWASPKQTAALSPPFILVNSVVGLFGALVVGQTPSSHFTLYAMTALIGAITGTAIGLLWLGQIATKLVLAAILIAAGIQLMFF